MVRLHSYGDDVSFYHYDRYARNITQVEINNIGDIVHYLKRGVDEDIPDKNLYLARGFVIWLGLAYEDRSRFKFERYEELFDFPVNFFEFFCRSADIECEIICGKTKAVNYKVGDENVDATNYWLTFKVEEQWHLIQPSRCVRCIEGHSHGGEILLELDGIKAMDESPHKDGQILQLFDDFTFCTHPDLFLYNNFPDDPKWQLRQDSKAPITFEKWVNLPYLTQSFFQVDLKLLSEECCRLTAHNGRCTIQILAEETTATHLESSNKLYISNDDMPADLKHDDLPMLVLAGRDANIFSFEIRFPVVGNYRFVLYFGQASEKREACCEFSIRCDTADPNCRKLPVNSSIGFGYTRQAEEAGLSKPSVSGPKIFFKSGEDAFGKDEKMPSVNFRIAEDALDKEEYGSFIYSRENSTYYEPKLDESCRRLDITPQIPRGEMEFAIMVGTRPKNTSGLFTPLLYYIVTSEDDTEYKMREKIVRSRKRELRNGEKKTEILKRNTFLQKRKLELEELLKTFLTKAVSAPGMEPSSNLPRKAPTKRYKPMWE